jgi:hypothetical protein
MKAGVGFAFLGMGMLAMLAGCGRGFFQGAERAPWRHEAEVACLKSGKVKLGAGVVRIDPIEGPGICGADFPLKVSALGEAPALSFADDMRPPATIPSSRMPRWPVHDSVYAQPSSRLAPVHGEILRWTPGPPPANVPRDDGAAAAPMPISPPGVSDEAETGQRARPLPPAEHVYERRPLSRARAMPPAPNDVPADVVLPGDRRPDVARPRTQQAYNVPGYQPPPAARAVPSLGPMRGPATPITLPPVGLKPAATLACPLVSALDRWVSEGVQPAALHWFNSPVVEIHQIGGYSCRSMIGAGTHHISEHAFGDALDIAGFTLADGRTITVKNGWHGSPEEQGFLHDVQLYACETFNTVLAPGYNPEHYNHIHVDLMRRASGRTPCRPTAVRGEIVAARARAHYASRHRGPAYTGSITRRGRAHDAVAGADGYVDEDDEDAATPLPSRRPGLSDGISRLLRAPGRQGVRQEKQTVTY